MAARPEALMRSRYAAFALGLGPYLVETLAASHPDRRRPPAELARDERTKQAFFIVEANRSQLVEVARLIDAGKLRPEIEALLLEVARKNYQGARLADELDAHIEASFGRGNAASTRSARTTTPVCANRPWVSE